MNTNTTLSRLDEFSDAKKHLKSFMPVELDGETLSEMIYHITQVSIDSFRADIYDVFFEEIAINFLKSDYHGIMLCPICATNDAELEIIMLDQLAKAIPKFDAFSTRHTSLLCQVESKPGTLFRAVILSLDDIANKERIEYFNSVSCKYTAIEIDDVIDGFEAYINDNIRNNNPKRCGWGTFTKYFLKQQFIHDIHYVVCSIQGMLLNNFWKFRDDVTSYLDIFKISTRASYMDFNYFITYMRDNVENTAENSPLVVPKSLTGKEYAAALQRVIDILIYRVA